MRINRSNILNFLLVSFLGLTLFSCQEPPLAASYTELPLKGWHMDTTRTIELNIEDTVNPLNFYLNLRHDAQYPYANFFLFMKTELPTGRVIADTLECILAKPSGQWLGSGLGDILDNKILFQYKKRAPEAGTYIFTFRHGMRDTLLPSVKNIGLIVEKYE